MTYFDPLTVFHAMCDASRTHVLPVRFRTDLTRHDRAFLRRHDGSPFGWILYEHGTHVALQRRAASIESVRRLTENFGEGSSYPAARFYVWDGAAFREVTADRWAEILIESRGEVHAPG